MLRRLHADQPDSFAFTPDNLAWAKAQMTKYPEGRQASAIIPLLWRAQEQEGWLTRPAIEHVADMLGLAYIRALEVATFYFMFQLRPVGSVAHVQVCGTTSCMICGAEDLVAVCRERIAPKPHQISEDGKLSWEEVECLGACANAPMAQIGKDYYEDLTVERFGEMLDRFRSGAVPLPGPQQGRWASEPAGGATSLDPARDGGGRDEAANASVALAAALGDTVKRIDGTEVPLRTPWHAPERADDDPVAASRDPMMHPDGPDGRQGGRIAGADAPDRDRGDSSDGYANVRGSDADATARPGIDDVADRPEGHPGQGLGADATARDKGAEPGPQVTGTVDDDGEPAGTKTAAEATSTPEGSTGSGADGDGASGDLRPATGEEVGGHPDTGRGRAPAAGSATGHDPRLEESGTAGSRKGRDDPAE